MDGVLISCDRRRFVPTYFDIVIAICDLQIVEIAVIFIFLNIKVKKGNDDELVWVCGEDV